MGTQGPCRLPPSAVTSYTPRANPFNRAPARVWPPPLGFFCPRALLREGADGHKPLGTFFNAAVFQQEVGRAGENA